MSITFGFYNSVDGDRAYDAEQISSLFDGVINDGVFMNIGTQMIVAANTGMTVSVGAGRAWFNKTWTLNDAPEALTLDESDLVLDRIDIIALEVDSTVTARENAVKIIKGTPAGTPVAPTLQNGSTLNQYPLAEIYVSAGVTEVLAQDITNKVGTSACPFVTGILETVDMDDLLAQWNAEFMAWFQTIEDILDENVAGNLLLLIQANDDKIADINQPLPTTFEGGYQIRFNSASTNTKSFLLKIDELREAAAIKIKKNTEAEKPLLLFDGTVVEEVPGGYARVVEEAAAFIYAPSGGGALPAYYGDGSDGVFETTERILSNPNVSGSIVSGSAANLLDGDEGTSVVIATDAAGPVTNTVFTFDLDAPASLKTATLKDVYQSSGGRNLKIFGSNNSDYSSAVLLGQFAEQTTTSPIDFTLELESLPDAYQYYIVTITSVGANLSCSEILMTTGQVLTAPVDGGPLIYQCTEVNIAANTTIGVDAPCQGLYFYCTGDVTIDGVIDMNERGFDYAEFNAPVLALDSYMNINEMAEEISDVLTGANSLNTLVYESIRNIIDATLLNPSNGLTPGGLGGNGGYGGGSDTGANRSVGGVATVARGNVGGIGGGGGGGEGYYSKRGLAGGPVDGNGYKAEPVVPTPLGQAGVMGNGGAGAENNYDSDYYATYGGAAHGAGGGGGGGSHSGTAATDGEPGEFSGGLVCVIAKGNINVSGSFHAKGGDAGNGGNGACAGNSTYNGSSGGGGGGAGGGVILLYHKGTYINTGSVSLGGGAGGVAGTSKCSWNSEYGGPGTAGSVGSIAEFQL